MLLCGASFGDYNMKYQKIVLFFIALEILPQNSLLVQQSWYIVAIMVYCFKLGMLNILKVLISMVALILGYYGGWMGQIHKSLFFTV